MGICGPVRVISPAPPVSARIKPLPKWIGRRPRRSGNAKVDCPSPPYVVQIKLNNVSFSEIGSNDTSQKFHPTGAKLPANILISPTYGWAMIISLVGRREYSLERDAEGQRQEGLHIQVRLTAADIPEGVGRHCDQIGAGGVNLGSH